MSSTRRQTWLSFFRPAPASRKGGVPVSEVRPRLEILEDRLAPVALIPTTTTISASPPTFSFFTQTETVTTQTNLSVTTKGVNTGLVAITDGGQTQTVSVNGSGQASATFKFTLLQELQNKTFGSHPIGGSYSDPSGVFGSSTASGQAPGNTAGFFIQLYFDFLLFSALSGSTTSGTSG
jgi:hypothetical protein